jgi:uroporphyrinogen decarboxylase
MAGVFEDSWYLTGLERIMIELVENPAFVEHLLDRMVQIQTEICGHFLEEVGEYLDMIEFWEDISSQAGPLMSPDTYRRIVKPRTHRLIAFVRDRTPAKIALHSCGSVAWALEDLIEIGVEVLNPVQVAAQGMDTAVLKSRYGDRISFWGGIDTQRVLLRGTAEEVRAEVRTRINDLAPGGGYLLTSVHNVQPDVPAENIVAMFEEARRYGRYPIGRSKE